MKATGVVRRIDDLGRIVIPIEIRRSMKIRDGDPLEIFVDKDGEVILKKYSAIADMEDFVKEMADTLHEATGMICLITDRDRVVVSAGAGPREFVQRPIGPVVIQTMEDRRPVAFTREDHRHPGPLIGEDEEAPCPFTSEVIAPVVVGGDPLGAVILCTRDQDRSVGPTEQKLAETAAGFLARHMEE
nr:stage V sporulation protein T [Bacillota bacterium]